MSSVFFPLKKALQIYGLSQDELRSRGLSEARLPEFARSLSDNRLLKSWSSEQMPGVGALVGFMQKPANPIAASIFVTKGGVLKSSLTLNLARMAALHGIRTCVVGLDMQGDITTALSADAPPDEDVSLSEAVARLDSLKGLANLYLGEASLEEITKPTDIPTLFYVPETPELVALDQSLISRNRREYWLRDHVVLPLKQRFDLILMDCSPNWNRLITNALVASDYLLSPIECKINNFRNFNAFRALINEFRDEMALSFDSVFVPTRLSPNRKLSREIFDWYRANLPECTQTAIRESSQGEEATAMRLSVPEYAASSGPADEMRELIRELWAEMTAITNTRVSSDSRKAQECLLVSEI